MSKMSNLYLEQSEIAQNYIGDYADGKYPTIEAAKKAFTQDKSFVNFVGAKVSIIIIVVIVYSLFIFFSEL